EPWAPARDSAATLPRELAAARDRPPRVPECRGREVLEMTDPHPVVAPLLLAPRFGRRVWGGNRLGAWVARPDARDPDVQDPDVRAPAVRTPDVPAPGVQDPGVHGPAGEPIGECWLAGDDNRVIAGPYAGRALRDVVDVLGEALVGSVAFDRYGARMP